MSGFGTVECRAGVGVAAFGGRGLLAEEGGFKLNFDFLAAELADGVARLAGRLRGALLAVETDATG